MAYIKKLKYNELVGGTDNTDVYPVTSTEAVYGPDNINQQTVNEDRLRRIELLEKNVHSLDGLKEMVEAFISGDYDYQGGLSDNNFTDELKAKLDGLENYNDAELRQLLADIDTAKANAEDVYTKSEIDDKLGDIQGALTFDNIPIAGSDNPVKSSGIYTALQGKQDTISDLNDIRTHASEFSNSPAASITSTNINSWNQAAEGGGTITGITMNGSSKGTSGVVDLGTVVTQEADPTVPQWAKAANKPAYTAQEVGALPTDTQFMNINGTSVKSNNSINVYYQTAADNKFATKTELNGYATENYVTNALANVVYIGDDAGSASSSGEGEGGGEVTPSGDYVTTSDFNAAMLTKANDSAVVHKTGSETISGEKNFNDRILLHSTAASEQEPVEGEEQATTTEDTVLSRSYIYHQGHDDFSWIITSADEETDADSSISLQNALDNKVSTSSDRLLPTVTASNNGKILKVVNGVWTLSDDATGGGGGSTVHVDNSMQGYPTIADLYVSTIEDLNWGDSDSWDSSTDTVMSRGAIERTLYNLNQSLVNTINALADRVSILENKLASLYSFDSTNSTLTINDPNSSNS